MASNRDPKNIFSFFGLPRELRDAIYDESLTVDGALRLGPNGELHTRYKNLTTTNLLLVSRQFKHEYHDRSAGICELVVEDHLEGAASCGFRTLPPKLSAISTLKIKP